MRPAVKTAQEKNPVFRLRRSHIQGQGAFAVRPIKKGTRVVEYAGERISNEEADRRYDDDAMNRHHTFLFAIDAKTSIDGASGGNEAAYINHSCDPNCEAVADEKRIFIDAIKDIAVGEELTYDYRYARQGTSDREAKRLYPCFCGAATCRGTILAPRPKKRAKKTAAAKPAAKKTKTKAATKTKRAPKTGSVKKPKRGAAASR